jgi:hypothetical protein
VEFQQHVRYQIAVPRCCVQPNVVGQKLVVQVHRDATIEAVCAEVKRMAKLSPETDVFLADVDRHHQICKVHNPSERCDQQEFWRFVPGHQRTIGVAQVRT